LLLLLLHRHLHDLNVRILRLHALVHRDIALLGRLRWRRQRLLLLLLLLGLIVDGR
jgi:hypothetical protein